MLKEKKVLFISPQPFFEWRGSPIRVLYNLLSLSDAKIQTDFLTLPIGVDKGIENVRIIRCVNPLMIKKIKIGPSLTKLFFDFILLFHAFFLMLKHRYDIIHTIEDAGIIGTFLSFVFKSKHIHEKHSDTSSYNKGMLKNLFLSAYEKVENFVIKYCDAVIGTGPMIVDKVLKKFPQKKAFHIYDIPSSLKNAEKEKVSAIKNKLKENPDEVIILYVGSFAIYQGIELMFNSIPLVTKQSKKARFIIIGGNKDEIQAKQAWLNNNDSSNQITFIGKIKPDDLPNYLAAADILLSPRISGYNTPLKLLDYLKSGRTILATNYTANKQILNQENCFFVELNKTSFSQGIIELIDNPQLREKLSNNGKTLIEEKYNYQQYSSLIKKCYESVFPKD